MDGSGCSFNYMAMRSPDVIHWLIIIDVYVFIYNDDDDDYDGDYDNNDDDDDTYFTFIDGFMLMGYPVPMST